MPTYDFLLIVRKNIFNKCAYRRTFIKHPREKILREFMNTHRFWVFINGTHVKIWEWTFKYYSSIVWLIFTLNLKKFSFQSYSKNKQLKTNNHFLHWIELTIYWSNLSLFFWFNDTNFVYHITPIYFCAWIHCGTKEARMKTTLSTQTGKLYWLGE